MSNDSDDEDLAALVAAGPARGRVDAPPAAPEPTERDAGDVGPSVPTGAAEADEGSAAEVLRAEEIESPVAPPPSQEADLEIKPAPTLADERARSRPVDAGTARYLPLPAARLVDQWVRLGAEAETGVGILFVSPRSTPVHAVSAGTVERNATGRADQLTLRADDGREFSYGRLEPSGLPTGRRVEAGEVIGKLGEGGPRLRFPYLEMGVREVGGRWCNPYEVFLGLPDAEELDVAAAASGLAVDPDDGDPFDSQAASVAPPATSPLADPVDALIEDSPTEPADGTADGPSSDVDVAAVQGDAQAPAVPVVEDDDDYLLSLVADQRLRPERDRTLP